ncbi:MAG: hypothetical protein AAFQ43_11515 [Bacteroidota bacterium]
MLRLLLFAALLVSGCSVAEPSDPDIEGARSPEAEGVVVNRTSTDFVTLAVDVDIAAVINIASEITDLDSEAVVRRGEAAPLDVYEYRKGKDFIVYIFRVRGDRATLDASLLVKGDTFERDDRVVTVERF